MQRQISHEHTRPRLMGFTSQVDGSTAVIATSIPEAAASRNGTGDHTLTFTQPFARNCVAVGGILGTALPGGYVTQQSNPGTAATRLLTHKDTDGALTAGACCTFVLGWDALDTDAIRPIRLMADRLGARIIAVEVNTAGSAGVVTGKGEIASIVRNGTGDVTLTFRRSFQATSGENVLVAVGTAFTATPNLMVQAAALGVSTVQFKVFNATAVATDASFHAFILGWDVPGPMIRAKGEVETGQIRARLIAGRISITAGVPDVSVGAADFGVQDTATGQVTVVLRKPFVRAPIVIGNAEDSNATPGRLTVSSVAAGSFILNTGNAAGAAADITSGGGVHFMALGFDDPTDS